MGPDGHRMTSTPDDRDENTDRQTRVVRGVEETDHGTDPDPTSHVPFLTLLSGGPIGRVYEIASPRMLIGRLPECAVVLDDDSVSRRHAELRTDDIGGLTVEDLGSTNGTFINGRRVETSELVDGDHLRIGFAAELKVTLVETPESRVHRHLYEAATRDALTGLFNQRTFLARLAEEFSFARRHRTPLALVLIDVDAFKQVNDRLGHGAGDDLLRQLAKVATSEVRAEDVLCRYGGDELAVILRATPIADAAELGERIRRRIEARRFPVTDEEGRRRTVEATVSVGAAEADRAAHVQALDLLHAADRQLLRAKREGRNRVCAASDDPPFAHRR